MKDVKPRVTMFKNFTLTKKLVLFLFICLLLDFFLVPQINIICRDRQGFGFSYQTGESQQRLSLIKYGSARIIYNFRHFFVFWSKAPFGKTYHNLNEFLHLDNSALSFNILHFFAFLIFALVLFYFFQLKIWQVFLIGLGFNVFHEFIAEGICIDPSFNDLWVNMIGLLVGIMAWEIFNLIRQHIRFKKSAV
ncbi:MAG: hypothetical protein PHV78_02065 [Patescibacteria group bacterium]|nr:hypothetical protein [Patescibacteria group bacterium]MDD5121066.1 hypothetical protein [Patescibacteria group bacterium]MDD5221572.1 hypothetical protein [Patescibacteria group bacterium]MDD5396015.1 hypothetical protein [Patescibacteria group bacterium]